MLRAGEWHRLERQGTAIGYALRRSVLTLTAPQPEYYAERILLVKAGTAAPLELYNATKVRMPWIAEIGARLRRLWAGAFAPHSRPTTAAL